MKKLQIRKTYNYNQSSAVEIDFEGSHELTAYSADNPYFEITTSTEDKIQEYSREEARKEYWPFLEPV